MSRRTLVGDPSAALGLHVPVRTMAPGEDSGMVPSSTGFAEDMA